MLRLKKFSARKFISFLSLLAAFSVAANPLAYSRAESRSGSAGLSDDVPWTPAQTVSAAFLAAELKQEGGSQPVIIYVGFRTLYLGGHIPGAVFHGPGSTPQGI